MAVLTCEGAGVPAARPLPTRDGKKMSKRLKNYPDPSEILNAYGADALRCAPASEAGRARRAH